MIHRTRPAAAAATSIDQRRAQGTSRTTGPWISFNAAATPSAAPPHHCTLESFSWTQAQNHNPDRPRRTRLIWPSEMLPITGSNASESKTRSAASCQSSTRRAFSASQMKTASDALSTSTAPTVITPPLTPTRGCSIQASTGGMTYCGPVGSRQPIVAQRSYGSKPDARRPAARM